MGLIASAFRESKSSTLDLFRQLYGGLTSLTGKNVNAKTALQVSAVFGCGRVISEGVAQVPLKIMQRAEGRNEPAIDHPLYEVLALKPNPWQTSFEFRETLMWHAILCGNFIGFKNAPAGVVREIIPFEPGWCRVDRADDLSIEKYHVTFPSGRSRDFPPEAIWHVRGPSWNSWMGLEAVAVAREAIGLAMATEESQARLHRAGVRSSGMYSMDGKLSPDQFKELRTFIEREMGGSENAGRPFILDRGAKWNPIQMTGVDAQHLETRIEQIREVCRFMRVMPIMLGVSDKTTTYASAEQMFLAHVVHTLDPWYERLEQSIDLNLLTERDRRDGHYAKFVRWGLLRGSLQAMKDYLLGLVNGGLMWPNEARELLDLNADPDPASNKLRIPVNVAQEPKAAGGGDGNSPPADPNA